MVLFAPLANFRYRIAFLHHTMNLKLKFNFSYSPEATHFQGVTTLYCFIFLSFDGETTSFSAVGLVCPRPQNYPSEDPVPHSPHGIQANKKGALSEERAPCHIILMND